MPFVRRDRKQMPFACRNTWLDQTSEVDKDRKTTPLVEIRHEQVVGEAVTPGDMDSVRSLLTTARGLRPQTPEPSFSGEPECHQTP